MIDANGSYKLSAVRVVAKADTDLQEFLLYPNPAISYVNIALTNAAAKDMQVQIMYWVSLITN